MPAQPADRKDSPATALRVIGRLDPPAFRKADFSGFSRAQIRAGLTVRATLPTEAEVEEAARVCPVFRGPFMMGAK